MKTIISAVVAVLAIGTTVATTQTAPEWKAPSRAAKKKNPVAADAASLAAGKKVYVKECLTCHGASGRGDGPKAKDLERPPGNLANPKLWEQSDGELYWKITTGNKPMPAYETTLPEADRWHAVNFIRTFAPRPGAAPP